MLMEYDFYLSWHVDLVCVGCLGDCDPRQNPELRWDFMHVFFDIEDDVVVVGDHQQKSKQHTIPFWKKVSVDVMIVDSVESGPNFRKPSKGIERQNGLAALHDFLTRIVVVAAEKKEQTVGKVETVENAVVASTTIPTTIPTRKTLSNPTNADDACFAGAGVFLQEKKEMDYAFVMSDTQQKEIMQMYHYVLSLSQQQQQSAQQQQLVQEQLVQQQQSEQQQQLVQELQGQGQQGQGQQEQQEQLVQQGQELQEQVEEEKEKKQKEKPLLDVEDYCYPGIYLKTTSTSTTRQPSWSKTKATIPYEDDKKKSIDKPKDVNSKNNHQRTFSQFLDSSQKEEEEEEEENMMMKKQKKINE